MLPGSQRTSRAQALSRPIRGTQDGLVRFPSRLVRRDVDYSPLMSKHAHVHGPSLVSRFGAFLAVPAFTIGASPWRQKRCLPLARHGPSQHHARHACITARASGTAGFGAQDAKLLGQMGLILLYVLVQAAMSLYMKFLMSKLVVAPGLVGIPASFLITGLQQLVALGLFLTLKPVFSLIFRKKKSSEGVRMEVRERAMILCLAAAFAFNMGLNNFSLAFIPLSVNQVIRACGPLVTAILQTMVGRAEFISRREWMFMVIGVTCAVTTVVARAEGSLAFSSGFIFGACLCAFSVVCSAIDLLLKQATQANLRLSPFTAMGYMSLPAFALLLVPGMLWKHQMPSLWNVHLGTSASTDLVVVTEALKLRPSILKFAAFSGVLAFGYNTFTTYFAGRLSATTTSLIGNFPTVILLSLFLFETDLPSGRWGLLFWASVIGNIASFAAYKTVKRGRTSGKS